MNSDVNILKLLVTSGADTKAVDFCGQTCVDLARLYKNTEAANYFSTSQKLKNQ